MNEKITRITCKPASSSEKHRRPAPHLRLHPLALALTASGLVTGFGVVRAEGLPSGMTVVQGQASVITAGNRMMVTNSSGAILNWKGFSIGPQQSVRFDQPNAASKVLNRVTGNDPSSILGSLSSNGQVWLLNPNGVLFGQGARVDVGGLVASTLNLSDADWTAGRYHFAPATMSGRGEGAVVNKGELRTSLGGHVMLIGSSAGVSNEGVIDAPGGQVVMTAGQSVDLVDTGAPNLTLRVTAAQGEALNLGSLSAAGGRIDLQAAIVNQQGIVRAETLERGAKGEIVLRASQSLNIGARSVTSASGASGGLVTLDAGSGTNLVSGAVNAIGSQGQGGQVQLLGRQVGVIDAAHVDASGRAGGGDVLVGGGQQGKDPKVRNAESAFIGPDASISANATELGDGGRVIVWSDRATRAYGHFSATGGAQGGNGGFIETSGGWLDARPASVATMAPKGRRGQWLIDPNDIDIVETNGELRDINITEGPNFTTTGDSARILTSTIATALNAGNNVSITTGSAEPNSQAGDITMSNASISVSPRKPATLTLQAQRNILISDSTIEQGEGAALNVNLSAANVTLRGEQIRKDGGNVATVDTAGRIELRANRVDLDGTATVISRAQGDAIVVATPKGVTGVSFFDTTNSDAAALAAPNGRWLVYAGDLNEKQFNPGHLAYDFKQYNARFDQRVMGRDGNIVTQVPGNGFLFTESPTANLSGAPVKVYDGNAAASLAGANLQVGGLKAEDRAVVSEGASGLFDDKNSGANKVLTVDANGISFIDSLDKPVFGYTLSQITGTIKPKALTVTSVTAADKVYDANRLAAVNVGPLGGLIGNETLATTSSGQFDTKDVVTRKAVTVALGIVDGGNGGMASNYTLSNPTVTTTANITPKSVAVSGVSASDKTYDASRTATVRVGSVSGLVGNETLATTSSAQFDTKDAGQGKTVTVALGIGDGGNGGLASNYTLSNPTVTATADITPKPVSITSVTAANKTYDASRTATVNVGTVSGLVGNETLATTSNAQFDTKDAGQGKTVTVALGIGDGGNGGLASNYTLSNPTVTTTADIMPKSVSITSVSAANKTYDASRTAAVNVGTVSGLVGKETLATTSIAQFDTKDAGQGKTVTVALGIGDGGNGGLAGNYVLSTPTLTTTADITPATLTYVATPSMVVAGTSPTALSGSLRGFVGDETQARATRGTMVFSSTGRADSPPGIYSIQGSGLSASNYVFTQAAENAVALTILPPLTNSPQQAIADQKAAQQAIALPIVMSGPARGRALDVMRALQLSGSGEVFSFQSVPVGRMSQEELATLLAARDQYKKALFAEAISKLENEPGLADAPNCQTAKQLETGDCLITEALKREIVAARNAGTKAQAKSSEQAPPTVSSSGTTVAGTERPIDGKEVTDLVEHEPTAAVALSLHTKRRVKSAALPQIERKIAVLIGVDSFVDKRIPGLQNAVSDARSVGQLLEASLGYETIVVKNGSKQAIVAALNRVAVEADVNDSVVIYYAGHGELVAATGLGYWQPASADASRPETWLSNSDIEKLLSQISASQVALISDSCYSGSLITGTRIRASTTTVNPSEVLRRKAAVVMSSGGNEPVFDAGKEGHSPFAWNLMRTLQQVSNWQMGGNVFERVRFAVAKELPQRPQYGSSANGGHQAGSDYLFEQRQLDGVR